MIKLRIDVTKINKAKLFKGEKGTYLDVCLIEKREIDQWGNDYMAVQDVSKEEREKGIKGAILGNGKTIGQSRAARPASPAADDLTSPARKPTAASQGEDVPF